MHTFLFCCQYEDNVYFVGSMKTMFVGSMKTCNVCFIGSVKTMFILLVE